MRQGYLPGLGGTLFKMCDPFICGSMIGLVASSLAASTYLGIRETNRRERRERIRTGLEQIVDGYHSSQRDTGSYPLIPDDDLIFEALRLPRSIQGVVLNGQQARDEILFNSSPPTLKEASRYLAAQRVLQGSNQDLLYVLDPALFVAISRGEKLVMDSDVSGCTDGTYKSTIAFVAHYRNLVGEDYFTRRRVVFSVDGTGPWYFERPDYQARLMGQAGGASF